MIKFCGRGNEKIMNHWIGPTKRNTETGLVFHKAAGNVRVIVHTSCVPCCQFHSVLLDSYVYLQKDYEMELSTYS
jgi:hypothetical protein